jgi:hypothetical protein
MAAACALLAVGAPSAYAEKAPTPLEIEQAQARWEDGKKAFDRGDFQRAWLFFKQAYAAYPHPAFLQNLGETELRIGKFVDAARHLARYLRDGRLTQSERDLPTRSLKKASARLGAIVVATDPDVAVAEVRVDGEWVGETPLDDAPWYVEPGEHTVVLHKDGYFDARYTLNVPIGPPTKVLVLLKPIAPVVPAASTVASAKTAGSRVPAVPLRDNPSGPGVRTIVLASEGLVSAAGLAMGIGYLLAANSADEQARFHQANVDAAPVQPPCITPTETLQQECQALHNARSDAKRDRALSAIGFVGAGVSLAALAATALLWKSSAESRSAFRLEVGPGRASATLTWRY